MFARRGREGEGQSNRKKAACQVHTSALPLLPSNLSGDSLDEAKEALQPLLQDHEIKMAAQQQLLVHYRVGGVGLTPFGNQHKQLANHETTVRVRDGEKR